MILLIFGAILILLSTRFVYFEPQGIIGFILLLFGLLSWIYASKFMKIK